MATKKKEVKVRDLKPSKDAKGGAARSLAGSSRSMDGRSRSMDRNSRSTDGSTRSNH